MGKLPPDSFIKFPSGSEIHPWRLIHRDGTISWKQALIQSNGELHIPTCQAHEAHIIKTAQRIEELNCWVSQNLEPWECLQPTKWYTINGDHQPFAEGYACCVYHLVTPLKKVAKLLEPHIQSHETLELKDDSIYFCRC